MCTRLVFVLLLVLASQRVYGQSEETVNPEDADEEQQTQIDTPEDSEGSGATPLIKTTEFVPIMEEESTVEEHNGEETIECPTDLCTCTYEKDGDNMKVTADCSSQDLTALPTGIDKRVTHLLLNNNNLEELPKGIAEFKELEELNVNDNSIKDFAFGSVSELPKLRILKAANNRLMEYPRELKNGLDFTSLRELDIGNNDMREELSVDAFRHMTNLSTLTLPTPSPDLVAALCHRLGPTLQKVCTNDCSIDEEECTNYPEQNDDLITISEDNEQKQGENKDAPEQTNEETDELITVSNDSEKSLEPDSVPKQDNEEPSGTASKGDDLQAVPELDEEMIDENGEETSPTIILPEATPSKTGDLVPEADYSIRSAVSAADEAGDIAKFPSVSEDKLPTASEGETPAARTMDAPIERPSDNTVAVNAAINKEQNKQADDNIQVGAASVKKGSGIDNSVIALIVAGMIVVVAGVTIKKNWSAIRGKCNSRPTPATAAAHGNGTTPEEVPLQDKNNIV